MSAIATCQCGSRLQGEPCIPCLLQLGLDAGKEETPFLKPGDHVGPYELMEQIGEGGCGIVFLAEQLRPVRRHVALKVIKPGMDSRQVIARFDAERQALALLDHPNIAKIFDAGATDCGRPFFVMEHVRGLKITEYCDRCKLCLRERIGLFLQVCHAVQHAHQKGLIHRDLKPSNILVSEGGEIGAPKIIDFGIAKSTEQSLTDRTLFTALHHFIGTPAYMSPEQAGSADVDTRSDIYALGILLYELLAGVTPFDGENLRRLAPDEIIKFIRDTESPRPSARLTTLLQVQLKGVAECRGTEPGKLLHLLRGDLDCIVMKCLEKDRGRRYESVSGLALDLQRHLCNEPITARPPSHWYRFEKMVRRNRTAAGAIAAITLTLIVGAIVSAHETVRAWRAEREQAALRAQAQGEAAKNAEVARFLKNILQGAGPSFALGHDTTMLREILNRAAERLGRDLTNQPEAQAELFSTLAETSHELGLYEKMNALARESLRVSRLRYPAENTSVVRALAQVGDAEAHLKNFDEGERFTREALEMRRRTSGDESPDIGGLENNLGLILRERGQLAEAEKMFLDALAFEQNLPHCDDPAIATDLSNLGAVLASEGRLQQAETRYREALALRRRLYGEEHPDVASTLGNLSAVLFQEKKFAEAETFAREALALDRKFLGANHPDLALAKHNLAAILEAEGKKSGAGALDGEVLRISKKSP